MNEALRGLRDIVHRAQCRAEQASDDAAMASAAYARALWVDRCYDEALRQFHLAAKRCPEVYERVLGQYEAARANEESL